MVVGVVMIFVLMGVALMVVLMAVLVFVPAMIMMVMLMLMPVLVRVRVLVSCFVAVEPGHIGVDAMLVYARNGNLKAVDRQRGELFAQVFLAGAQVEQGRDGHIAADARGAVDDKRVLMVRHEMLLNGREVCRRPDD